MPLGAESVLPLGGSAQGLLEKKDFHPRPHSPRLVDWDECQHHTLVIPLYTCCKRSFCACFRPSSTH